MNDDFAELIQYLDDKFIAVDKRFDNVDQRFIAIDKRFDDVDKRFIAVDKRFDEIKSDFNNLLTAVDAYVQKADTYFQEMVMLSHKVDRHEKWLQEIAEKIGVKLKY